MSSRIIFSNYLIFLAIGHVLADFYFQTNKIAAEKAVSVSGVAKHALEDFVVNLVLILPFFSWKLLIITIASAVVHFVVDVGKLHISMLKIMKGKYVFLLDQFIHIICMILFAFVMMKWDISLQLFEPLHSMLTEFIVKTRPVNRWVLALLLTFRPCHFLVRAFMTMRDPIDEEDSAYQMQMNRKGRYVGYAERLLILVLCYFNFYAIIGIILLVKTILQKKLIDDDDVYGVAYVQGTLISLVYEFLVEIIVL